MSGTDDTNWYQIVATGPCPECGFDATAVETTGLGVALSEEAELWQRLLAEHSPAVLRLGGAADRWSPLEYACHVRGVFAVFAERVGRAVGEDHPEFGWWDHERAAVDEAYNDQDPFEVASGMAVDARGLIGELDGLDPAQWQRTGMRRAHEEFTVEGLARFALHEAHHHRFDATVGLGERPPDAST